MKDVSVKKNGIKGYDILGKQMQSAYTHISEGAPDRVLTLGGGCDAEKQFIKDSGISAYTAWDIHADHGLLRRIAESIQNSNIYIHLDLDVTDPGEFADTPLPVAGGLRCEEVYGILEAASDKIIGLGIYEYIPSQKKNAYIEKLIKFGLAL